MSRLRANKNKTISFRVSEADLNAFKSAAKNNGVSLSDFLYDCITNHRKMDNKHEDMLMKIYFLTESMKYSNSASMLDAFEKCSIEQGVEVFAKDIVSKIEVMNKYLKELLLDLFNVTHFDGQEFTELVEDQLDRASKDVMDEALDVYMDKLQELNEKRISKS